jgi:ribonucleotide reductase alpha subunit
MVICDADHPDIEEFIDWKVIEEQKVASLVAGSKLHEQKLNGMFAAIRGWDGEAAKAADPAANPTLKSAIRDAKRAMIPETYVKRCSTMPARAMRRSSSRPMTPTGIPKPMARCRGRTPTTRCA